MGWFTKRGAALCASIAVAIVVGAPALARACPGCFGSSDLRVLKTYYLSTLMLSLLPLGLVAAVIGIAVALRRSFARQFQPTTEPPAPQTVQDLI